MCLKSSHQLKILISTFSDDITSQNSYNVPAHVHFKSIKTYYGLSDILCTIGYSYFPHCFLFHKCVFRSKQCLPSWLQDSRARTWNEEESLVLLPKYKPERTLLLRLTSKDLIKYRDTLYIYLTPFISELLQVLTCIFSLEC